MSNSTHYVIVRRDLPYGFLVAQVVHAAGESSPGNLSTGTNAVVLSVADEAALAALQARLVAAGVAHAAIYEPDRANELTAIGLCPVADRRPLKHFLQELPLLGRQF